MFEIDIENVKSRHPKLERSVSNKDFQDLNDLTSSFLINNHPNLRKTPSTFKENSNKSESLNRSLQTDHTLSTKPSTSKLSKLHLSNSKNNFSLNKRLSFDNQDSLSSFYLLPKDNKLEEQETLNYNKTITSYFRENSNLNRSIRECKINIDSEVISIKEIQNKGILNRTVFTYNEEVNSKLDVGSSFIDCEKKVS